MKCLKSSIYTHQPQEIASIYFKQPSSAFRPADSLVINGAFSVCPMVQIAGQNSTVLSVVQNQLEGRCCSKKLRWKEVLFPSWGYWWGYCLPGLRTCSWSCRTKSGNKCLQARQHLKCKYCLRCQRQSTCWDYSHIILPLESLIKIQALTELGTTSIQSSSEKNPMILDPIVLRRVMLCFSRCY